MTKRIIHIAQDEKFINSAYLQFETAFPGQNLFYILVNDSADNFKFVQPENNIIKIGQDDLNALKFNDENSLLIFHSLAAAFFPMILKLPKTIKCLWLCFGFEVYNDKHFYSEAKLLDVVTMRFCKAKKTSLKTHLKQKIQPLLKIVKPSRPTSELAVKKKVFKRMDYFGTSFSEEYSSVLKLIHQRKKFFSFWYYPLEKTVDIHDVISLNQPNILVGNSGHSPGNHLDVFYKLKKYDIGNRKVIVPLSYGNLSYIELIQSKGNEILGNAYEPLNHFMTLSDYNQIIKSCGVAILNNRRQQAVGNTIGLLWFGSKVFLSDKNPFYHYLKRIGIIVFCYETELSQKCIDDLLTLEQINFNRNILRQFLSNDLLQEELKRQLEEIL